MHVLFTNPKCLPSLWMVKHSSFDLQEKIYALILIKKIKYSVHDANLTWKITECDSKRFCFKMQCFDTVMSSVRLANLDAMPAKCYFLLAEARKRQKMFFSRTAGGLGRAGRQVRPLFVVASLWPDLCFPIHPPYKVILRQFCIKLSCLNCNFVFLSWLNVRLACVCSTLSAVCEKCRLSKTSDRLYLNTHNS